MSAERPMTRRIEVPYTTEPIRHGLDTPTPEISVFRDGCSALFEFDVTDRDTVVVQAGHFDPSGDWIEEPADLIVVERR